MTDTIHLEPLFMRPTVAHKEANRCDELADTFERYATDPGHPSPVTAAEIAEGYRRQAALLREIARPTAPRVTA